MDLRIQPESDHDLLISLWTFLVGTNGNGFIAKFDEFAANTDARFDKSDERLESIETQLPRCWTREDHERVDAEYKKEKEAETKKTERKVERRRISMREWILVAITLLGPIAAVIIAKIF